jgi:hypothetical protein
MHLDDEMGENLKIEMPRRQLFPLSSLGHGSGDNCSWHIGVKSKHMSFAIGIYGNFYAG